MSKSLTLIATGDIFLGNDEAEVFLQPVLPMLRSADILIGNLETPVSDRGTPSPEKIASGSRPLRMQPYVIGHLKQAGFHAMSMANNHGMDFGEEALCDTMDLVDDAGIARAGAGRNLAEAQAHVTFERGGVRIALVSMTWVYTPVTYPARENSTGMFCVPADTSYEISSALTQSPGLWPKVVTKTREPDKKAVLEAIARAREDADVVVAACHWGISSKLSARGMGIPSALGPTYLADYQIDMGHAIIDAGADMVVGHHPHKLQPVEIYRGRPIAYSLGNFLFTFHRDTFGFTAAALKVEIDTETKRMTGVSLIPLAMTTDTYRTHVATGAKVEEIAGELRAISWPFDTQYSVQNGVIIPTVKGES